MLKHRTKYDEDLENAVKLSYAKLNQKEQLHSIEYCEEPVLKDIS